MKERICCVCRKKGAANTRIRVGREKLSDGTHRYFIDKEGNANGRGAYVCYACIDVAVKKRALNRSFKCNIPSEIYEELVGIRG
ncbi:MAG: YlxR family protein [Firmicutes bacterium]|nr:YlxR family protein [Bacillota bacterium]